MFFKISPLLAPYFDNPYFQSLTLSVSSALAWGFVVVAVVLVLFYSKTLGRELSVSFIETIKC